MKRTVLGVLIALLSALPLTAANNFPQTSLSLGMAYDDATAETFTPDSAYTFFTGGDAIGIRFSSPVAQTDGALKLYAYCTAIANTPEYTATLRASASAEDDTDRPDDDAGLIATSDEITPSANDWEVFTFSGITLVAGTTYWLVIANTDAGNEGTDTATWQTRGAIDGHALPEILRPMAATTTVDGFSNDPTVITTIVPPFVLAFADGSVTGNPYVVDGAAHASNQNYRGNAFSFSGKVSAGGIVFTTTSSSLGIYNAAGDSIVAVTLDQTAKMEAASCLFAPTNLTAGTTYYMAAGFTANSTVGLIYTMGEAVGDVPADVLACRPFGAAYVDAAATANLAASADASKIMAFVLILADIPVADAAPSGRPSLIIIMVGRGDLYAPLVPELCCRVRDDWYMPGQWI